MLRHGAIGGRGRSIQMSARSYFIGITVCVAAILVSPALAQQEKESAPVRRGERGGRARNGGLPATLERFAGELDLTADQRKQWDALVEKYRELAAKTPPETEAVGEDVRKLREASDAGDEAGAAKGRQRLRQRGTGQLLQKFLDEAEAFLSDDQKVRLGALVERARGEGRRSPAQRIAELRQRLNLRDEQEVAFDRAAEKLKEEALARFFDDIESFLSREQLKTLDEMRSEFGGRGGGPGQSSVRRVLAAARRSGLTDEQRDWLRGFEKRTTESLREAKTEEAQAELAAEVEREIRNQLTGEQLARFDAALERSRSRR
jgi:LTXXQ motif family protein